VPETSLEPAPPSPEHTTEAPPASQAPAARKKPPTKSQRGREQLESARAALASGEVAAALKQYSRLIRRKYLLAEVIADLEAALVRYPVDVDLLQALGDAYMRADRLREALEAYSKAEALLR
jgi:tetratricopeptide (TPR) repeat protein